jgi:membrane peptidoglycan carboxypeptidase
MNAGPVRRPSRRRSRGWTGLVLPIVVFTACVAVAVNVVFVGLGLAAKEASDRFLALPSRLDVPPLPQRSVMVDAEGTPIAWFYEQNRSVVPLGQIAPVMRQALVDIEDSRFYGNPGIDLRSIGRALVRSQAGAVTGEQTQPEGASTLTQQYVKNLRLAQARTDAEREEVLEVSYARKLEEARYALQLADTMSKNEILEGYLNLVFFGNGAHGVQAAAERYFSVPASALTLPQAALLAGIVKNPTALDPTDHPDDALERRNVVLGRMLELGHVTADEHGAATAAPLGLDPGGPTAGCTGPNGYFCGSVLDQLLADERLGKDEATRQALLETGGLTIVTTLHPRVQAAAVAATARARGSRANLATAVVRPGSGEVLALAASQPFGVEPGQTSVNLPVGGSTGFQAGSTFKVFVLAQAIAQGIPLDLELFAPQVYVGSDNGKPYPVANAADSESGLFTLEEATWHSVNTWYMQLQERTGISGPAALAEAMGVRRADGSPLQRVPSFTLGTNEVTPLAMAGAYATFAARGKHCPPRSLVAVRQPAYAGAGGAAAARLGDLTLSAPPCRQVLPSPVADTVTSVLTGVITQGTGRNADPGRPAAGKTGTVQDFSSAWFAGYTPDLAAAVWMGDPRGGYRYPLRNVAVGGVTYPQVYGGGVPAQTWSALVREALRGSPPRPFPVPPPRP